MNTVMPRLAPEPLDELVHVAPDAGVESAERLVEQEQLRLQDQGLRDGKALLHAARQRGRHGILDVPEAHRVEHRSRPRSIACRRAAPPSRPHQRFWVSSRPRMAFSQHGQMREHRVALEDDAALRPRLVRQRRAVDQDLAPARTLLPEQDAQERALPAAGGADERDEAAARHVEVDPLQDRAVAIALPQALDLHPAHQGSAQAKSAPRQPAQEEVGRRRRGA